MITTLEGIYENGHVIFKETPPIKKKSKVLVTFVDDVETPSLKKRPLGTMKGTIKMSDDFNDPIEDLKDYM
jgi:hypothetical protein